MAELYHLGVPVSTVPDRVVLVDPALSRADVLAPLRAPEMIASRREYVSHLANLDGEEVMVTTVGIGAPPLAIAVEELSRAGTRTVLLLGTGRLKVSADASWLVVSGAARGEGTSGQYAPMAFPAVPDARLLERLMTELSDRAVCGLVSTVDLMPDTTAPDPLLATDLRCAALFVVAAARGVAAGAVLTPSVSGRDLSELAAAAYASLAGFPGSQ